MAEVTNEVSKKIVEDWGTVKHFCKKNDINIHTFRVVIQGQGKSQPICDKLIRLGYIKDASELMRDFTGADIGKELDLSKSDFTGADIGKELDLSKSDFTGANLLYDKDMSCK